MRHRLIASLMLLSLATTAFAGDDAVKAGSAAPASKKALPAKAAAAQAAAAAKKNVHQDPAQTDKAIAAIDAQIAAAKINKSSPGWRTNVPMFKTVAFDPARSYYAQFITNKGVVATEGTSTLACVDREGKPKMMPEELWSTEAERLPAGHDGAPRRAT